MELTNGMRAFLNPVAENRCDGRTFVVQASLKEAFDVPAQEKQTALSAGRSYGSLKLRSCSQELNLVASFFFLGAVRMCQTARLQSPVLLVLFSCKLCGSSCF